MAMKIRKGDRVKVIAGRSKGKIGDVLRVLPTESRVVVSGVNVIKRHTKPGRADAGGIMPPKSTWFEPKLADGMVNHVLD